MQMNTLDDYIYIEQVINGNTAAYAVLVDKYKDMVFTIARRIAKNQEDAEEIAQDAFLKAYQSLDSFKRKAKFSTWLYRIVYNTAISKIRKKRHETTALDDVMIENYSVDEVNNEVNGLDSEEQKKVINLALEKLNEEESTVISLYYLDECSIEDISGVTGLTKSNVKVKLHRSRKKLYQEMNILLGVQYKEV